MNQSLLSSPHPFFTGRLDALDAITNELNQRHRATIIAAPGMGKTELAIFYANEHREDYDFVWTFPCSTEAERHAGYHHFAEAMSIRSVSDQDSPEQLVSKVHFFLANFRGIASRWLIIYDDLDDIEFDLPATHYGDIVITTHVATRNDGCSVFLSAMNEVDAMRLFVHVSKRPALVELVGKKTKKQQEQQGESEEEAEGEQEWSALKAVIIEECGCIPFLVTQAAYFLTNRASTFSIQKLLATLKRNESPKNQKPSTASSSISILLKPEERYRKTAQNVAVATLSSLTNPLHQEWIKVCGVLQCRTVSKVFMKAWLQLMKKHHSLRDDNDIQEDKDGKNEHHPASHHHWDPMREEVVEETSTGEDDEGEKLNALLLQTNFDDDDDDDPSHEKSTGTSGENSESTSSSSTKSLSKMVFSSSSSSFSSFLAEERRDEKTSSGKTTVGSKSSNNGKEYPSHSKFPSSSLGHRRKKNILNEKDKVDEEEGEELRDFVAALESAGCGRFDETSISSQGVNSNHDGGVLHIHGLLLGNLPAMQREDVQRATALLLQLIIVGTSLLPNRAIAAEWCLYAEAILTSSSSGSTSSLISPLDMVLLHRHIAQRQIDFSLVPHSRVLKRLETAMGIAEQLERQFQKQQKQKQKQNMNDDVFVMKKDSPQFDTVLSTFFSRVIIFTRPPQYQIKKRGGERKKTTPTSSPASSSLLVSENIPLQLLADCACSRGHCLFDLSQYGESQKMHELALSLRRQVWKTQTMPFRSSSIQKKDAEERNEEVRETEEVGIGNSSNPIHPDVALSLDNVARCFYRKGEISTARSMYREALSIRWKLYGKSTQRAETAVSYNNIGNCFLMSNNAKQGLKFHKKAYHMRKKVFGMEAHVDVAASIFNVACCFQADNQLTNAQATYQKALVLRQQIYDFKDHTNIAKVYNCLGIVLFMQSKVHSALENFGSALEMGTTIYGKNKAHSEIAVRFHNIGRCLYELGDFEAASSMHCQGLAMWQKVFHQNTHADIAACFHRIALCHLRNKETEGAQKAEALAIAAWKELYQSGKSRVVNSLNSIEYYENLLGDPTMSDEVVRQHRLAGFSNIVQRQQQTVGEETAELSAGVVLEGEQDQHPEIKTRDKREEENHHIPVTAAPKPQKDPSVEESIISSEAPLKTAIPSTASDGFSVISLGGPKRQESILSASSGASSFYAATNYSWTAECTASSNSNQNIFSNTSTIRSGSCSSSSSTGSYVLFPDTILGSGRSGTVYKGFDNLKGCFVAIKVAAMISTSSVAVAVDSSSVDQTNKKDTATTEHHEQQHMLFNKNLQKEYLQLCELHHPNIVQVLAYRENTNLNTAQIIMEYFPGGSVQKVMLDTEARIYEGVIRRYLVDVLKGLVFVHERGFVHRDLKPGNMLLAGDGSVKLSDFGSVSREMLFLEEATVVESSSGGKVKDEQKEEKNSDHSKKGNQEEGEDEENGSMTSTICYMAPEALQDPFQHFTSKSDIWSLACSVIHMASGKRPWHETGLIGVPLMVHILTVASKHGEEERNQEKEEGEDLISSSDASSIDDADVPRQEENAAANTTTTISKPSAGNEDKELNKISYAAASKKKGPLVEEETLFEELHYPPIPVHLSASLHSILRDCFCLDPKERPSAWELLNNFDYFDIENTPPPKDMEKLRDFRKRVKK